MSLSSLLNIARSALFAQQQAMSVTAHNVANAQTIGYSRQRIRLVAASPEITPTATFGRGVTVASVERVRNTFYDSRYRAESGLLGDASTTLSYLTQIESALDEPSNAGLGTALDSLFSSFADLANDPSSLTSRGLVQQAGSALVQQLHRLDAALQQVSSDALTDLQAQAAQVNSLAARIADLNQQITTSSATGDGAPDLQDQRDVLIDELSSLVDVRVLRREDGSVGVLAGDALLVDGGLTQTVVLQSLAGGGFRLVTGGGTAVALQSGSIHSLCELANTKLPAIQAKLDALAQALVTTVNGIHRTGYTLDGTTGTDFFDPAGVTARSIQLTPAILASGSAIAAGGTLAPGDGDVALALADLAGTGLAALGGRSFRDYYVDLAGAVGSDVSAATTNANAYQTIVDQADALRSSTNGVSVDEEMVLLINQQAAYSAAARLIQVAQETAQTLLDVF